MANDDTPELGRLVVLHGAILAMIIASDKMDFDEGEQAILKEADALTMRVAHRSRSAQNYHETERGKAAIDDAKQIVAALDAGEVKGDGTTFVEIVNYTWDKEQLDNPMAQVGQAPTRKIVRRWYVDEDLHFLSPELQRKEA